MSEAKTLRIIATNTGRSPRGINTVNGTIVLQPGQRSQEITIKETERNSLIGSFGVEELGEGEPFQPKATLEVFPSRLKTLSERMDRMQREIDELKGQRSSNSNGAGDKLKSAKEILDMAKDANVPYGTFKDEAAKLLGADMPKKKDEILAALEELATKP